MDLSLSNTVARIQGEAAVQGDQVLRAANRLGGEVRDRVGRVIEDAERRDEGLRRHVDELVGMTFYGTLLKTMRNSALKGPYGHGRGEEVFRGQLDMLLAQRMGQARRFELNEAIFQRLSRRTEAAATTTGPEPGAASDEGGTGS